MILRGMYCSVLYILCSSVRSWIKLMQNPWLGKSNLFHMGLFPILNLGLSLETNRCLKYFLVVHADSSCIFYLATTYVTGQINSLYWGWLSHLKNGKSWWWVYKPLLWDRWQPFFFNKRWTFLRVSRVLRELHSIHKALICPAIGGESFELWTCSKDVLFVWKRNKTNICSIEGLNS